MGGVEALFEAQVWTTYDLIRIKGMLDIASKIIFQTTDRAFANRNKTMNLDNGEILIVEDGKRIEQIQTGSVNIALFEKSMMEWEEHAKSIGGAYDPTMGKEPTSGTPFASLQLQVQQGLSLHEYRKGKLAVFLDEIYQDWIIPYIAKEITNEQRFLSELDLEEMQAVAESMVASQTNKMVLKMILSGQLVSPQDIELHKQMVRDEFMKGGNKKFIEILKNEFKDAPISVKLNIAGKQKNLSAMVEKMVNVFKQIIATPQVLDDPRLAKIFNQILEASGLEPIDFYSKPQLATQAGIKIQPPQTQIPNQMVAPTNQPVMAQ